MRSVPKQNGRRRTLELVKFGDIFDGTSSTLPLGERNRLDANFDTFFANGYSSNPMGGWGYWAPTGGEFALTDVTLSSFGKINDSLPFHYGTKPGSITNSATFDAAPETIQRLCAFGSLHAGGAHFALADGSARFIGENIDHAILQALSTRAGIEVVRDY